MNKEELKQSIIDYYNDNKYLNPNGDFVFDVDLKEYIDWIFEIEDRIEALTRYADHYLSSEFSGFFEYEKYLEINGVKINKLEFAKNFYETKNIIASDIRYHKDGNTVFKTFYNYVYYDRSETGYSDLYVGEIKLSTVMDYHRESKLKQILDG